MRRRFTIAIIGIVLATLIVAGFGTLALAGVGARKQTENGLRDQAEATASILDVSPRGAAGEANTQVARRERFNRVRNALSLEDLSLVVLRSDNEIGLEVSDPLPDRLTAERLQPDQLRNGETTSGSVGNKVWAASPLSDSQGALGVVVLTRPVDRALGPAVGWFVLASLVAIVIAAFVASRLAKQLTKPLRSATDATTRIAAGDLSVRLPADERRHDEITDLSTAINQMAGTLERSRGLEQQFLLSVSHDLRTPLTSIRGYAEAVADGTAPDSRAAAAIILAEAQRLERLVKDLLDLAKLETRQFTLDIVAVDIAELSRRAADGLVREATAAGIELHVRTPPTAVVINTDPDRLGQVLANLLENALKYASNSIVLTVAPTPDGVSITVIDDGPGIAPEDLPHVFERLYVARSQPVRKESGSGLGLAIVRELVDAMGGQVTAAANPDGGTRMVVSFPAPSGVVMPPSMQPF